MRVDDQTFRYPLIFMPTLSYGGMKKPSALEGFEAQNYELIIFT